MKNAQKYLSILENFHSLSDNDSDFFNSLFKLVDLMAEPKEEAIEALREEAKVLKSLKEIIEKEVKNKTNEFLFSADKYDNKESLFNHVNTFSNIYLRVLRAYESRLINIDSEINTIKRKEEIGIKGYKCKEEDIEIL